MGDRLKDYPGPSLRDRARLCHGIGFNLILMTDVALGSPRRSCLLLHSIANRGLGLAFFADKRSHTAAAEWTHSGEREREMGPNNLISSVQCARAATKRSFGQNI